jgi:hypothetical protein
VLVSFDGARTQIFQSPCSDSDNHIPAYFGEDEVSERAMAGRYTRSTIDNELEVVRSKISKSPCSKAIPIHRRTLRRQYRIGKSHRLLREKNSRRQP